MIFVVVAFIAYAYQLEQVFIFEMSIGKMMNYSCLFPTNLACEVIPIQGQIAPLFPFDRLVIIIHCE